MDVMIADNTNTLNSQQLALTKQVIDFAAIALNMPENSEMSVIFVDDAEIKSINATYRDKNQSTDVISFALEDDESFFEMAAMSGMDIPVNIGDIFISVDKIKEQSIEYGHSFERELGFLLVHGFLHLNGYDHMTPEDEQEMFDLQRKILDDYGLSR